MITGRSWGMNRFKFRAWHKIENKMCKINVLTDEGAFCIGANVGLDDYSSDGSLVVFAPTDGRFCGFEEIILMQFTGLVDCAGKDVYEGDILEVVFARESKRLDQLGHEYFEKEVVIPCEISIGFGSKNNWHINKYGLVLRPLLKKKRFFNLTRGLECQLNPHSNQWERKVIGNVYENIELVEELGLDAE